MPIDWRRCPAVRTKPVDISGAAALLDDPRVAAETVIVNMDEGMSVEGVVETFGLETLLEDVLAVYEYAKEQRVAHASLPRFSVPLLLKPLYNQRCFERGTPRDTSGADRMQFNISKLTQTVICAALLAGAYSLPAAADVKHHDFHHRMGRRIHHSVGNDIIVTARPHTEPVAAGPDAFHGPAAIITAPVAIVGTIVSLPFRVVEAVFSPSANDPRVLVGAPVHFAGQIAEFPFNAVNGAFGVPPTHYY